MFTVVSMPKTYELTQKISKELKPNPYNFPIINKWNYKYVYNKYKFILFNTLSEEIEKEYPKYLDHVINSLVDIKSFKAGENLL